MRRVLSIALALLLTAKTARACEWAQGFFHEVTALRGEVVGAKVGLLQYVRWLRPSFARKQASLTLYEYRWPINARNDLPLVKRAKADANGHFDLGFLQPGHYTLSIDAKGWGTTDWYDVEVKDMPKQTESVTIDVSPHFPDCQGGHEFPVQTR
jgi:hypothetical protein